jgi:hypothetical protein
MRIRRTADQWQEILKAQREAGQTDSECSLDQGVSVASLRNWRKKLRGPRVVDPLSLVELQSLGPAQQELRVILPNGVVLSVSASWPLEHLVKAAGLLRAL